MLLCIFILLPLLAVAQPTPPQIAWSYRYFDGDTSLTYADHAVTAPVKSSCAVARTIVNLGVEHLC
ncbi:MAG: hypothetical protein IPK53_02490 [bacterium]|nr:hypothetical protein [bacterium]